MELAGSAALLGHSIRNASLDAVQRQAVERILQSRDFITLFRVEPATGKSYTCGTVQRFATARQRSRSSPPTSGNRS